MSERTQLWLILPLGRFGDTVAARLTDAGYDVERLSAAEGAITRLNYSRPAAIVVAVDLPEMRLFSFGRWVRGIALEDELPIIAVVRDRHEVREAEASACDAIVRIPLTAAGLAREIDLRVRLELAVRLARSVSAVVRTGPGLS